MRTTQPDPLSIVTALDAGADALPATIQWMPPGEHEIRATKGGKPASLRVKVDAATAESVRKSFEALVKAGKRPYLDFNHAGGEAAARVTGVSWGGDDPKDGGVRVSVEWSAKGADDIKGGSYFSFSPTFLMGTAGRVTGTTANMGGLVNEPAFGAIAPVSASETQTPETMTKLLSALVTAGAIPSADLSDDDAAAAVTAHFAKVESDKAESAKTTAAAVERAEKAEELVKAAAVRRADELVQAACADGRIPPKDEAARTFWRDSIVTAGAPAEAALRAVPMPAALKSPEREPIKAAAAGEIEAKQSAKVAEVRARSAGMTYDQAFSAAAAENPDLFRA